MQMIEQFAHACGWARTIARHVKPEGSIRAVAVLDVDAIKPGAHAAIHDRTNEIVTALRGVAGDRGAVVFQKDMAGMELAESVRGEYKPCVSTSGKALRILVV